MCMHMFCVRFCVCVNDSMNIEIDIYMHIYIYYIDMYISILTGKRYKITCIPHDQIDHNTNFTMLAFPNIISQL